MMVLQQLGNSGIVGLKLVVKGTCATAKAAQTGFLRMLGGHRSTPFTVAWCPRNQTEKKTSSYRAGNNTAKRRPLPHGRDARATRYRYYTHAHRILTIMPG